MRIQTITLDVREDIRAGREPFSAIMAAVAKLTPRQDLLIIAPFEPQPLFQVLAARGFRHSSQQTDTGDFQVLFTRRSEASHGREAKPVVGAAGHCRLPSESTERVIELDARGLEPPQPLVTILEALTSLPPSALMQVHTDRRPMHLYPQLEERGFTGESQEQADGSFITQIRRH
jgi:uncharacterized protein (DUF2249 family)